MRYRWPLGREGSLLIRGHGLKSQGAGKPPIPARPDRFLRFHNGLSEEVTDGYEIAQIEGSSAFKHADITALRPRLAKGAKPIEASAAAVAAVAAQQPAMPITADEDLDGAFQLPAVEAEAEDDGLPILDSVSGTVKEPEPEAQADGPSGESGIAGDIGTTERWFAPEPDSEPEATEPQPGPEPQAEPAEEPEPVSEPEPQPQPQPSLRPTRPTIKPGLNLVDIARGSNLMPRDSELMADARPTDVPPKE